jgi:hypothetical protein
MVGPFVNLDRSISIDTYMYMCVSIENNTIKLGLGDFVFYSVLVSRAAMFDISAMWGCVVAILMVIYIYIFES